jgi:hypothetical protein
MTILSSAPAGLGTAFVWGQWRPFFHHRYHA